MHARMTSYADNFEDVLLARAFPEDRSGFYIDVGAFEPVEHSVTKHFYDRGWRGINVEPNPDPFAKLRTERIRDVNLNVGLSDREGELTLYSAPSACWSVDRDLLTGWFAADPRDIIERRIPVTTLAQLCEAHVPTGTTIDFLKVDVEGHETAVLAGNDWNRWRPRIVLVEANDVEHWEPLLLGADYHFALFEGVNRFYVRSEDSHLLPTLSVPANVADQFLIHGYIARIHDLEQRLAHAAHLTRGELALANRLHALRHRHPRLASLLRPMLRRLACA